MPPRPPPSPGWLTIFCSIAAAAALWVSYGIDQLARGLVGRLFGVPFNGWEISARGWYLPRALQGPTTALGAGGFALMVFAGAFAVALLAWGLFTFVRAVHAAGWLRAFALEWVVIAAVWIPAAMASAVVGPGGGPGHELYARLGPPMAGRWTAAALGLVGLFLAAGLISASAVAVGRAWMRADGVDFRRRLVRVTAGWPAVIALALLAFGAGWAPSGWTMVFLGSALGALQLQTR